MNEKIGKALRRLGKSGSFLGALPAMILGAVLGIALYWGLSPSHTETALPTTAEGLTQQAEPATIWTCSMHPEINLPKPGLCPKCGMKLIPLKPVTSDDVTGPRVFTTTEDAKALMKIQTSTVERLFPTAEIRMVGKVDYDETRLAYITAWVPGRLERLFVDYTGIAVKKGDHMVSIYSPDLYSAQEELIQALATVRNLQRSDVDIVRKTAQATVDAVREKLRLLGLTEEQVAQIEQRGKAEDHVTIYAPVSGIVIQKNAQEGMYVQTGTRIYTIADLSHVWVKLDAYESDLSWLRYGQQVKFTSVSYPGETFTGTISFIDPILDPVTRTVKVRVNVANPQGKFKPDMFVNGIAYSQVAAGGRVFDESLAGKWICPMHPEIVKDGPDKCDICGMPLVKAETLGYVSVTPTEEDKPLVIPATAALVTGTRAIVYVEKPDTSKPAYEGREIVLGPRAGDYYIVRSGLSEGERVVTRGNFKIDSALQIQARPSMMTPEGGDGSTDPHHGGSLKSAKAVKTTATMEVPALFRQQLDAVFTRYFAVGKALAGDDAIDASEGLKEMSADLAKVDKSLLSDAAHEAWMKHRATLMGILAKTSEANDLQKLRERFAPLSDETASLARRFPPKQEDAYYLIHCPMAFGGRGGVWLQNSPQIRNPYFGSAMLECGEVQETIRAEDAPASTATAPVSEHKHE
jgi:Cu(I)/Ag(I) efflux system membrane fusion protein